MKKYIILLFFFCMLLFTPGNGQTSSSKPPLKKSQKKTSTTKKSQPKTPAVNKQNKTMIPEIKWSGTVTVVENFKFTIGLEGGSERYVSLFFNDALPTLHRNIETTDFNFTDDKGTGHVSMHTETIIRGKEGEKEKIIKETCDCSGTKQSELHEVLIQHSEKYYRIEATPPPCEGSGSGDGSCGGAGGGIIIEKPLGTNPFLLSGTETIERDITIGKVTTTTTWNLTGCPLWSDPQTRLQKNMHSIVKAKAERFILRVHDELCIKLKVAQGFRDLKTQDEYYAKGRPSPPANRADRVTNARGGDSYHNYGLAIDVYIVKDNGDIDFQTRIPAEVAKIGKEEGFEWGGDWKKFKDYPHFEMTLGNSIKQLKGVK